MMLERIEIWLRCLGGLMAFVTLGVVFYGIWRGTLRPVGRVSGKATGWLRSVTFYLVATVLFLASSILLWIPLPLALSTGMGATALTVGALIYFPALAFMVWGRLALGKMYFVSTGFSTQLFADHQLVTRGPFVIVRHPMYLGVIASAFSSLLIYQTWLTALFTFFAPFVLLRTRREEQALAAEFGEQWHAHPHRVPAFLPRLCKEEWIGK